MRFRVRHPTGAEHEVELQGTVAVLGRDPSSDLVLNDAKCSRRHAVLEAGPHGIAIRDAGSANGIYVNGQKVERASLQEGDVVRLGEVQITVLAEDVPGTLVMGPEDIAEMGMSGTLPPAAPPKPPEPRPAPPAARTAPPPRAPLPPPAPPPPPARPPSPRMPPSQPVTGPTVPRLPVARQPPAPPPPHAPAARPRPPAERPRPPMRVDTGPGGAIPRPLTVTILAVLWMLSVLFYGVGGLVLPPLAGLEGGAAVATVVSGLVLALLSGVMGVGLWVRAGWARVLQITCAALGLCGPFFITSATILVYMLRTDVRILFSGRQDYRDLSPEEADAVDRGSSDGLFTGVILGSLFLVFAATGILAIVAVPNLQRARAAASESAAIGQVRTLISAQEAFRAGTCGTGYADLEGLTNPSSVIPNYPAGAPPFLNAEWAKAEHLGYRFELAAEDLVPRAEGCPTRSFRRYQYSATPAAGTGRAFLGASDGTIHVALGRPATADDPLLQ